MTFPDESHGQYLLVHYSRLGLERDGIGMPWGGKVIWKLKGPRYTSDASKKSGKPRIINIAQASFGSKNCDLKVFE